jgi:hypothetical protein
MLASALAGGGQLLATESSEVAGIPTTSVLVRVPKPETAGQVAAGTESASAPAGSGGRDRINVVNNSTGARARAGDIEYDAHMDDVTVGEPTPESGTVLEVDVLTEHVTTPTSSQSAPAGYAVCPKATTCKRYQLHGSRWPSDETGKVAIPYKFNDEGRRNLRAPVGLLESAFASSTQQWSKWNSNIVFKPSGTTTAKFAAKGKDGSCDDGTNVVTWHKFDASIIAAVAVCRDKTGKVVRDADLAMNVTQHWEDISGEPDSRHTFDIRSIVTHEVGHWLSFTDIYGGADSKQTMFGQAAYGETNKRTLALGDIVGLQKAYPCGKEDSCLRTGIKND